MKWLHFSDIHFNFDGYDTARMREELHKYLNKIDKNDIDAIFITGDFRFAPKNEFKQDTIEFIKMICKKFDVENNFYITPGNHDLNRNKVRTDTINSVRKRYDSSKGDLSLDDLKYLNLAFEDFNDSFEDSAGKVVGNKNPHRFIAHDKANIICINTSIISGEKSADEYGQLIVGLKFLEKCLKQIDTNKPTIAYGHHSLESLRYDEQFRVIELFNKYDIHLYLCGHNHIFKINNVSYNENNKIYEIFAGNLYTEETYSQCGFLETHLLPNGIINIKCHKWDFNERKWHLSNTYSDVGDGTVKNLNLYDVSKHSQIIKNYKSSKSSLLNVMMITHDQVALTVPVYNRKFFKKFWPVVHRNEFEYTLQLINAISTADLKIETKYNVTYQFSEIHIGGPTVNLVTYQYIMNYIPTYKSIIKKSNLPKESKFLSQDFIQIGESTGFSVTDRNGEVFTYLREDQQNDIGILIRLKINKKKTVHLIFGTGKRGTMAALNYLTNYSEDIWNRCQDKNYFLLLWGNYTNHSINFSKGIVDLSNFLED